jgi:IS30 family transposase
VASAREYPHGPVNIHARFTAAGLPVYSARPHSPWQHSSNENANHILREYFPKGVRITSDPKYLALVASEINDRPRKTHDWRIPSEILAELVKENAFQCLSPPGSPA